MALKHTTPLRNTKTDHIIYTQRKTHDTQRRSTTTLERSLVFMFILDEYDHIISLSTNGNTDEPTLMHINNAYDFTSREIPTSPHLIPLSMCSSTQSGKMRANRISDMPTNAHMRFQAP